MRGNPQIQIIARDRGGACGLAAAKALPDAVQAADRRHLMENASRAFLDSVRKSMRQICKTLGATRVNPKLLTAPDDLKGAPAANNLEAGYSSSASWRADCAFAGWRSASLWIEGQSPGRTLRPERMRSARSLLAVVSSLKSAPRVGGGGPQLDFTTRKRRNMAAQAFKSPIRRVPGSRRLPRRRAGMCDRDWLKAWASSTSIPVRHIR